MGNNMLCSFCSGLWEATGHTEPPPHQALFETWNLL